MSSFVSSWRARSGRGRVGAAAAPDAASTPPHLLGGRERDHVVAGAVRCRSTPVRASPMIARARQPLEVAVVDSGASVATTIMIEPSPRSRSTLVPERVAAELAADRRAHAPGSTPPKLDCTSTPTVQPPSVARQHARRGADAALPAERDRSRCPRRRSPRRPARSRRRPAPRTTCRAADGPRADVVECTVVRLADHGVDRAHLAPSPGCASIQSTSASAARHTHSVQVSRIGVSSSPSSSHLRRSRSACRTRCRRGPPPARARGRGCRRAAGSP